jgi:hypothetical protein
MLLDRVEVWSGWPDGSGIRKAILIDVREPVLTWRTGGEGGFTCQVPRGDATAADGDLLNKLASGYAEIRPGRCLRIVFTSLLWVDVRILDVQDGTGDAGLATITCGGLSTSLAQTPPITLSVAGGKATFTFDGVGLSLEQHLTTYAKPQWDAAGLTFLEIGEVLHTGAIDVSYAGDHVWSAFQKYKEVTSYEPSFRPDLSTGVVYVDWIPSDGTIRIGGDFELDSDGVAILDSNDLPTPDSDFGDQLTDEGPRLVAEINAAITRTRSNTEQRTRVFGIGANGITIAEATWVVAAVASDVIELADLGGGVGPILVDDQLNGLYLEAEDRTTRTLISDSSVDDQTVTVADDSAFTVGDRVRIRADSAGTKLLSLDDPAEVATHGVIAGTISRPDLPETVNIMLNADQSIWTGASSDPADGWAAVGTPTLTRTTTAAHVQIGTYSCRVQTNADGEGYAGPNTDVVLTASDPYVSGFLSFKLVSGKVRVELVATDGVDSWTFPDGVAQKAFATAAGVFVQVGVAGIDLLAAGVTSVRMRVVQDGPGTAEMYVDAGQVTESPGQLPLVIGAGPTQLWQAVNAELAIAAPTRVRYEGAVLDFYRLAPTVYPYHKLIRGALHTVDDAELGIVEGVRLLEVREWLHEPARTTAVFSSLASDLRSLRERLARPRRAIASGNAKVIGAHSDARTLFDFVTTNTDETGTSVMADFVAGDVGKTLWVFGAGPSGAILKTTVASVTDEDEIEMADAASASLTDALAILGEAAAVITLAGQIGNTGGADPTVDPNALTIAMLEARIRELALRIENAGAGEQGPPGEDGADGSGLAEVLHWSEARADMSGSFAYATDVDFTWGHASKMEGAFQADSTSVIVPVDGLYHFSATLGLTNSSGTPPEELEFYIYAEDHESTDWALAYLYSHPSDGSVPSATTGRLEFTIHMRAAERLVFEIASDSTDDDYVGLLKLREIVITRINELGPTIIPPPTQINQSTTTTTAILLFWSLGISGADTEIELNGVLEVQVTAGDTNENVTGLSASTEYVPVARHILGADESTWQKYPSVWTKPNAPTAVSAVADSSTQITITVTLAHANCSTRIKRGSTTIATLAPGETTFVDTGRTPNTSYTYNVDHSTLGGFGSVTSDTETTPP